MEQQLPLLGLIAGSGPLPLILAQAANQEARVIAVALAGYTAPELEELVQDICWVKLGELEKAIRFLISQGVHEAVMTGKIPQSVLLTQSKLSNEVTTLLEGLKSKQTEAVLGALSAALGKAGITLLDGRKFFTGHLAQAGTLTRKGPTETELKDVELGKKLVKEIGRLDIGQTVVLKQGVVLAVEAIEGTDAAIARGAELGGAGIVVVKMSKPQQDMRFDIPVVGKETLKLLKEVKASVLALEAQKTILLDREEMLKLAEEAGITLVAL